MSKLKFVALIIMTALTTACATTGYQGARPLEASWSLIDDANETAGNGDYIEELLESRTWIKYRHLNKDPIELGKQANIPVQNEEVKILGPSQEDSLRSLALKLWMIENAEHTIDVVYYIFKYDVVGEAMLGALCNAVRRGVDVRIMVDSIGSIDPSHTGLMALETCADEAGHMRTMDGQLTDNKARVQTVIFNALSRPSSWKNRRSHDKLLVIDGAFPSKAMVITGGRNISLAYYGIKADGSEDPTAYRDLEILLKSRETDTFSNITVGDVSTIYYTLLFLHRENKRLYPIYFDDSESLYEDPDPFAGDRLRAQESLAFVKQLPAIAEMLAQMTEYMRTGFHDTDVLLAHELANLTNRNVVTNTIENLKGNPNSIMYVLSEYGDELDENGVLRIVSPYMFIAKYYDAEGNVVHDGAEELKQWLREHPKNRVEIITNSVLTSDNFFAQSMIDMDVGPRLLLTPELEQAWVSSLKDGELNKAVVGSDEWQQLINHPQLFIYQTGRLDAASLGEGTKHYGKLHAKYFMGINGGFVGTANFDYRSRLYNNEMGFFYSGEAVHADLDAIFDDLIADSYRWGSPEWLEMRQKVRDKGGIKGQSTSSQRSIFKTLRATGADWLI